MKFKNAFPSNILVNIKFTLCMLFCANQAAEYTIDDGNGGKVHLNVGYLLVCRQLVLTSLADLL